MAIVEVNSLQLQQLDRLEGFFVQVRLRGPQEVLMLVIVVEMAQEGAWLDRGPDGVSIRTVEEELVLRHMDMIALRQSDQGLLEQLASFEVFLLLEAVLDSQDGGDDAEEAHLRVGLEIVGVKVTKVRLLTL